MLDDYHVLDSTEIDTALAFLIDNQPPRMHLVITTREDPRLPLARLRARGQLTELRAADLRFTPDEATEFLNQAMRLSLSPEDVAALEQRTEGWIVGLQLAALSMRGVDDKSGFIQSFTGSHHFVLDYLVEEVLAHQPPRIQEFLLKSSLLDRMCAPLCDAVLRDSKDTQAALESIQQANLFLIPLDNERLWYSYHHLFGDLMRKRLRQVTSDDISTMHIRASEWYEMNDFEIEAFQHAAAAGDVARAERLIHGTGVPLYFRGLAQPVLMWLESLPTDLLNARPSLWVSYAWALMAAHQNTQIENKLEAAAAALEAFELDDYTRDLLGHIAAIRAMDAAIRYESETIIAQAKRALDLLHPDNLYIRTVVMRSLAIAYQFQGKRTAARDAYQEALAMSEASGNYFVNVLATTGLGIVQELDNQFHQAAEMYQRVLDLVGDPNQPITCAAYLGLARIYYEWNDLDAAQAYGERGAHLAQQIESIDSAVGGEIFLARLKLARGEIAGAAAALDALEQVIRQREFVRQIPVAAALRVLMYLAQDDLQQAAHLAHGHDLPLSQARVYLAQRHPTPALAVLEPYRQQMEAKNWHDERLRTLVLQALAHFQNGDADAALAVIRESLALAAPGGCIRIFIDEGAPMRDLLSQAAARGILPDYTCRLLAAFEPQPPPAAQPLIEPLSERELEILALVADGFSNHEISEQLFISVNTVKGHNRNIFDKLHVKRRTEAVARARELGLI